MDSGTGEHATRSASVLPLRLATAAVGLPVLAVCVALGGVPLLIITSAAVFLAIWELRRLLSRFGRVLWPLSALGSGAFLFSAHSGDTSAMLIALTAIGTGSLGAALFAFRTGSWDGARSWAATVAAAGYPGALLASGFALRNGPDGLMWLSYAIAVAFASDTAAYVIGRRFGRHRLAPALSPGKTWEGAAAGVGGAVLVSAALVWILDLDGLPLLTAIALGAALSVLGQIGDLGESRLKRFAGVKDSGVLLPGHGGVLDRLDSLIVIIPAVFLYASTITTME